MTDDESAPNHGETELPPTAAVFLIKFDVRIGYTVAWKRTISGVEIDGVVEYKCLPSGLHNLKEDFIYFTHQGYAGLGAFINGPADASERTARLLAVGVLVPLTHGRLGRSWLHAENLRSLARRLISDVTKTEPLEEYWEAHRLDSRNGLAGASSPSPVMSASKPGASASGSQSRRGRSRAISNVTAMSPTEHSLPPFHPALSMLDFLDAFGPLVFPLHRAALLRKRILIVAAPPVRAACEYVYDISVLSSLPSFVDDLLPSSTEATHRLRPLFSVGVHDIPSLSALADPNQSDDDNTTSTPGWVACTTDEVLSTKPELYDVLVEMPQKYSHAPPQKRWPALRTSDKKPILATQRDLRRYKVLLRELRLIQPPKPDAPPSDLNHEPSHEPVPAYDSGAEDDDPDDRDYEHESDDETARLLRPENLPSSPPRDDERRGMPAQTSDPDSANNSADPDDSAAYDTLPLEPVTWSALAYSSFMWWATAGEKDAALAEETEQDRALLADLTGPPPQQPQQPRPGSNPVASNGGTGDAGLTASWASDAVGGVGPPEGVLVQTAVVAFFHRLTGLLLSGMAELIEAADDDDEVGSEDSGDSGDEGGVDDDHGEEVGRRRGPGRAVQLSSEDAPRLGLDAWSEADQAFAGELLAMYFGRAATARTPRVQWCGMRIC